MTFHFGYFKAITDNPLEMKRGTPPGDIDKEVPFDLPDDTTPDEGGVLTFMTEAVSPNNLTFTMAINDVPVVARKVDSAVLHSEQEVIRATGPFKSGPNKLQIKATGGTGTLRISDIVLHYARTS